MRLVEKGISFDCFNQFNFESHVNDRSSKQTDPLLIFTNIRNNPNELLCNFVRCCEEINQCRRQCL